MSELSGIYHSISNSNISLIRSLETKKFRIREGLFVVQGRKSVREALTIWKPVLAVGRTECIEDLEKEFHLGTDLMRMASEVQMRKMSTLKTAPDIIAVFNLPEEENPDIHLDNSKLYLLLDGIQDPGNLGSIMRTADWFGIEKVFCSPQTADIFNPKALMATMGSFARVRVCYTDLEQLVSRNADLPLYGTMLDGKNIYSTTLTSGGMVAFGNEGNGLSDGLKKMVTSPLLIPPFYPNRHAESLNVGAAAAVVLAEFRRS